MNFGNLAALMLIVAVVTVEVSDFFQLLKLTLKDISLIIAGVDIGWGGI